MTGHNLGPGKSTSFIKRLICSESLVSFYITQDLAKFCELIES